MRVRPSDWREGSSVRFVRLERGFVRQFGDRVFANLDQSSSCDEDLLFDSCPQWIDTPSCSVEGSEIVTQDYMVADQLEKERVRILDKTFAFQLSVEEYRNRKSRFASSIIYETIVCFRIIAIFVLDKSEVCTCCPTTFVHLNLDCY